MKTVNDVFIKYLVRLKDQYGIKQTEIADNLGVTKFKLSDIKSGRSSADKAMMDNLLKFYPYLLDEQKVNKDETYLQLLKRVVTLQEENKLLRESIVIKKSELDSLIVEKIKHFLKENKTDQK